MPPVRRRRRNDLILGATEGITSINGQLQSNQFLADGDGIEVISGSGTHTIGIKNDGIASGKLQANSVTTIAIAAQDVIIGKLGSGAEPQGQILVTDGSSGYNFEDQVLAAFMGSPNHQSSGESTLFFSFSDLAPIDGSNAERVSVVPFDCRAKDLIILIRLNNKVNTTTFTLMVNEGTTGMLVVVPAGAAGDDFHVQATDVRRNLTKGDRLSLKQQQGTPGNQDITVSSFGVVLIAR